jgi:hypothetical protein
MTHTNDAVEVSVYIDQADFDNFKSKLAIEGLKPSSFLRMKAYQFLNNSETIK